MAAVALAVEVVVGFSSFPAPACAIRLNDSLAIEAATVNWLASGACERYIARLVC